jgi:acetate kinase
MGIFTSPQKLRGGGSIVSLSWPEAEFTSAIYTGVMNSLKLVTCHLGNGCSLAAIREGHSIDTTMGFTPLEGLMMGTRSGSVDPGILTYLMREGRLLVQEIDDLLNKESGLLGI